MKVEVENLTLWVGMPAYHAYAVEGCHWGAMFEWDGMKHCSDRTWESAKRAVDEIGPVVEARIGKGLAPAVMGEFRKLAGEAHGAMREDDAVLRKNKGFVKGVLVMRSEMDGKERAEVTASEYKQDKK